MPTLDQSIELMNFGRNNLNKFVIILPAIKSFKLMGLYFSLTAGQDQ